MGPGQGDVSSICARTLASTVGATGNPGFRVKYPFTPKISMTRTSNDRNRMLWSRR